MCIEDEVVVMVTLRTSGASDANMVVDAETERVRTTQRRREGQRANGAIE